jgi:erythromycin esterase-like protein
MVSGGSGVARAASLADSLARVAGAERPELRRYARTLGRGLRLNRPEIGGRTRDASMAEEVLDLASSSRRVILWGDNTHVSRHGGAMGSTLAASLGTAYVAIGFSFHDGSYSAYGPHNPYRVHASYEGTHEHVLRMLEPATVLVELARVPASHPLRGLAGFRYMGSRPQEFTQFFPLRLTDHFDWVGFTERTEATRFLREHKF